jgi:hypothetical protein
MLITKYFKLIQSPAKPEQFNIGCVSYFSRHPEGPIYPIAKCLNKVTGEYEKYTYERPFYKSTIVNGQVEYEKTPPRIITIEPIDSDIIYPHRGETINTFWKRNECRIEEISENVFNHLKKFG